MADGPAPRCCPAGLLGCQSVCQLLCAALSWALLLSNVCHRVPDELPEAVHGLMLECMDSVPEKRPSARAIFDRLTAIHPLEAPS